MNELAYAAKFLSEIVTDLDQAVEDYTGPVEDPDLISLAMLDEAHKNLGHILRALQDRMGKHLPRTTVVDGVGSFEAHGRREGSTKCTDEEGLWREVLDTRVVDPDTGEIVPQAEVIRRAYGSKSKETGVVRLTGATPTKIGALGIPSQDFFEDPPFVGFTVKLVK